MEEIVWEKQGNKWFANFEDWKLCVCEPIHEDDKEFVGYFRFYGSTTTADLESAKEEIIKSLKELGNKLK